MGQGASKKEAEQEASRQAWERLKDNSQEFEKYA
jgi:dsRNA-specific ribonuclease